MEWIKLKDEKPKRGQFCIVCNEQRNLAAFATYGVFSPDEFCTEQGFVKPIYYWTPFNLPPKE